MKQTTKIDPNPTMYRMTLTKKEVNALKHFCDNHIAANVIEISQMSISGIGYSIYVQIKDNPETLTDITDIDSW